MARNRNQGQGQQKGRGSGGQIPWHLLEKEQKVVVFERQQRNEDTRIAEEIRIQQRRERIEDEDRAARAKKEAAEAEKDKPNPVATVNQTVSAILQGATFAFIREPLERHWNDFVDAANLTDTERAYCYKVLAQIEEEERQAVIKNIMQVEDTTARRQIATDRGLLPS